MTEDPLERIEREERERKEKKGPRTVMTALAAVAVVLACVLAYMLYQRNTLVNQLEGEKAELAQQMVALQEDFSALNSDYENINHQLDTSREQVAMLIEKLNKTQATNRAKIRQYEKELGTLRSIMKGYIVQIDSLNTLNKKLTADAAAARREAAESRRANEELSAQVENLSTQVSAGKVLRARAISLAGYYGNYYGHNLFMLLLFLIPALLIGVGWRRHLLNINSLFDKKLAETDLMICERDGIEVEHYRLSSLIKALMHNDEYRTQLLQRAARFNAAYPHLIRVGFVLLLALPLGLSVVMFSASNKLPWFIVWIVCLVLLCTALIIIEYFHESLTRKTAMVDLTKDEMYQLLGDQLDREYFSSPIERLRRRMSDAVAEAHQARQAAEDFAASAEESGEAAGAQTTLVLRRLIDGPHLAGCD